MRGYSYSTRPLSFSFLLISCAIIYVKASLEPTEVTQNNFAHIFEGEWMIMFYAPWCPACQGAKPIWSTFSKQWSEELDIRVGQVDVNAYPGLSGQFLVFSLPTIYHLKDGESRLYTGGRTVDSLSTWVMEKSWEDVEPVEWWRAPNSPQMRAVGVFFVFANSIRDLHELLTKTYNVPSWGVYVGFAVATIFAGLLVGLILVLICDCVFPPKVYPLDPKKYTKVPSSGPDSEGSGSDIEEETSRAESSSGDESKVRKRRPRKDQ